MEPSKRKDLCAAMTYKTEKNKINVLGYHVDLDYNVLFAPPCTPDRRPSPGTREPKKRKTGAI